MAQRLVRAKRKIRDANIPLPDPRRRRSARSAGAGARGDLPRLQRGPHGDERRRRSSATTCGPRRSGSDACSSQLMPDEPEAVGLLALMLLSESRRPARTDRDGVLITLADQDRSLVGPATSSPKGRRSSGSACAATGPGRTRSRRRSTPCTATRRPRRTPTGARSSPSTTSCRSPCRRRSSRSIGRSPSPNAMARPPVSRRWSRSNSTTSTCIHAALATYLDRLGRHDEASPPSAAPSTAPTTPPNAPPSSPASDPPARRQTRLCRNSA